MSAKRPAQYDIDQKTLEPKESALESKAQVQANGSVADQKERNILSVNKEEPIQPQTSENGQQKKQDAKPTSGNLFSNLFTGKAPTTNGSGLFSNTTESLFSSNATGLFSKPTGGLFSSSGSSSQPKTGGLFSNNSQSTGGSIFNFQSGGVPPIKNSGASLFGGQAAQEEDDSGDSAELEAGQNIEADPSKSTVNYEYVETSVVILKQKAFKFKKLGGDLIENVDVVVTQDKSSKLFFISIQLPATKRSIYTGIIIPNKSQVKHLNNKKENVEISAFTVVKGKPEQAVLRCQFQKQQQGIELHDTVEHIVKGTFVVKDTEATTEKKAENQEEEKANKAETEKKEQKGNNNQGGN